MKPIKCWNCLYLAKCMDYNKNGCDKFVKWKMSYKEVADLCKINVRTLYRYFVKDEQEALATVYRLSGLKLRIIYDGHLRCLVKVIDKGKGNER